MAHSETGLLAQAARDVVRAGGGATLPGRPGTWRTFTLAGQPFPYDLEPAQQSSGKRVVDLQTGGCHAEAVTLVFSYDPRREVAESVGGAVPVPVARTHPRRHAAVVRFGNGQAIHAIELDVAEGMVVTIPTQSVEVTMLSYGAVFPNVPEPPRLRSFGSAAYGSTGQSAKTTPCLVPLGLYELPGAGAPGAPLPQLADASDGNDVQQALTAAMARPSGAGDATEAYWSALARVLALVPSTEPIGGA